MGANRIEGLAQLHRALKEARLEARRAACRWDDLIQRCIFLEDLEEEMFPSQLELQNSWRGGFCMCMRTFCRSHFVRSCWHGAVVLWLRSLRPKVFRLLGCICGLLSVCAVLGQLTMFSDRWSLSVLSVLFHEDRGFWLTQLFCTLPLCYLVSTTYWSVFRLKIAGWYGLYSNHNTDTSSLLWCASILARLAPALCYHFVLLIRVEGTAFQAMMGQMNVVPVLGKSFNSVFPCIVGLLCCCNLLNVYSRLVQLCGLGALEFEWAPSVTGEREDLLTEGRRLAERERRRRSEDQLIELQRRHAPDQAIPLRVQIAQLIDEGMLPQDWNAYSS